MVKSPKLLSSAGCNQTTTEMLKNTIAISSEILYLLFSQSLSTGEVPHEWKKAKIILIYKSGDRSKVTNYRLISLTSIPSKLLEHVIASYLTTHLESLNYSYPLQHGLRKFLSCETQLAEFTHDIFQHMDNRLQTDAIFLDFSKAFDRVPHNYLLAKLAFL